MASFNSFVQSVLIDRKFKAKPSGDVIFTLPGSLYSETQRARYNFYNNKLTLVEVFGVDFCPDYVGVLSVGESFIMPFLVHNVHLVDNYAYLDVTHKINILTGKITVAHNPKMTYNLPCSADIEARALLLIPAHITNFQFRHISYDADTLDISFIAVKLKASEVEETNAYEGGHYRQDQAAENDEEEDERYTNHIALITKKEVVLIDERGYYGAAIRYEYNAVILYAIGSDYENQTIYSEHDGKIMQNECNYVMDCLYGDYGFCFTDAAGHNCNLNTDDGEYFYEDDETNFPKDITFKIQTNDGRKIFKHSFLPCPVGRNSNLADIAELESSESSAASAPIKPRNSENYIKECQFTPGIALTQQYSDGLTNVTDFIYCAHYKILYKYDAIKDNRITFKVHEILGDSAERPEAMKLGQSFSFDIRECVAAMARPTLRIEKMHLYVANMLKINIFMGIREHLPNPCNQVYYNGHSDYYLHQSDRYLIDYKSVLYGTEYMEAKNIKTGKEYKYHYLQSDCDSRRMYIDVAGDYLITNSLIITNPAFTSSPVNILVATPHFTIFEFVD